MTEKVPPDPVVDDSQRKVLVSPTVALSCATFVVKVSVIPTLRYALVGEVNVGLIAVMYRKITTPEPPYPATDGEAPPPPPPPPDPVFAAPVVANAVPPLVPVAPAFDSPPPAPPAAKYCALVPDM